MMQRFVREVPLLDRQGNVVAYIERGECLVPASALAGRDNDLLRKINEAAPKP